ncbi:MAG: GIY-YIG nuclease family protein [Pseudomonadota bacterium]
MAELPTDTPKIWLRSFYGFTPEEDGYIGWTEQGPRDRMLGLVAAGDLFLIYGAGTHETEKSQRLRVLGFLQVDIKPIRDTDKASEAGMARKIKNGWKDKWTFAIPVRRAWRADESILLERIAPETYRPEAGQAIAVWSPPLLPKEAELALKIKVTEVNVFGEPPLARPPPIKQELGHSLRPSRAFPGSSGVRVSTYEDGPTFLYVARFEGDATALLGRPKSLHDNKVLLKVGVTNDIAARVKQLNEGFPPISVGMWSMQLQSKAYPNRKAAEAAEQIFKDEGVKTLESLGGEFFLGPWIDAQLVFCRLPGIARFDS